MKKALATILTLCMVFSMFSFTDISAYADNGTSGENSLPVDSHETKTEKSLFVETGLSMSMDEFVDHLASYLPNDFIVSTENMYDDDAWLEGTTFSVLSSDLNPSATYIRAWYAQGITDSYTDHIDAYFDKASDFEDIAEYLFAAIDPEYATSDEFHDDLETILYDLNRKNEQTKHVKMANGYFVYSYTPPYELSGTWYPGFFGIRFLSSKFFHEIN